MRFRIALLSVFIAALLLAAATVHFADGGSAPQAKAVQVTASSGGASVKQQLAKGKIRGARYLRDQIVVDFERGATAEQHRAAVAAVDGKVANNNEVTGAQLISLPKDSSIRKVSRTLAKQPGVKYAEPNFFIQATVTPDDPNFQHEWGLNNTGQEMFASLTGQSEANIRLRDGATGQTVTSFTGDPDADIDAPEAWDTFTGGQDVTVAVVDTGIDYNHPDLANRVWTNDGETGDGRESNGLDDDNNGHVDDWRGWDFRGNGAGVGDNDPFDDNLHGTHVSGTIAAAGNDNFGISGVSWNSNVMPLKMFDANGGGNTFDSAKALAYAGKMGADVVNGSYGAPVPTDVEREAIELSPDTLFVFSAGNDYADLAGHNAYPCEYPQANIICVAATDYKDRLADFSNYNAESVDIGAPGVNILSDKTSAYQGVPGPYLYLSGTSMASPHVTGAAALLKSHKPDASALQIKQALLDTVDPLAVLAGKTTTGGRLNVSSALAYISGTSRARAQVSAPSWSDSIIYRSGTGTSDVLDVSESASEISFVSAGPEIDAGSGCTNINPTRVSCSVAGFTGINIQTYDLADEVTVGSDLDVFIDTGDGNDTFIGGAGDDMVLATNGNDDISGRGGRDTVTYGGRPSAVSVSLDDQPGDGGDGESDNVRSSIEVVRSGSANDTLAASILGSELDAGEGDDTLIGGVANDVLVGGTGTDTLTGAAGDDRLLGGEQSDTITGGDGIDTADFSDRNEPLILTLDGQPNDGAPGENDALAGDIENLVGGYSKDTLIGNGGDNRLEGGPGNDTLEGGPGSDYVSGGEHRSDHLDDNDTVTYASSTAPVSVTQDDIANDGEIGGADLDNIQSDVETIIGGSGDDVLSGGDDQNRLIGGPGNDEFHGGAGEDAVSYQAETTPVIASIGDEVSDGPAGQADDIGGDIEGILGGSANDELSATGSNNAVLIGFKGNDELTGGSGDDLFAGEEGSDDVHGGLGKDTIRYSFPNDTGIWWYTNSQILKSIRITLDDKPDDGLPGEGDNFHSDLDDIYGSPTADTLVGTNGPNYIVGAGGDDAISGGEGDDLICGDDTCADTSWMVNFTAFPLKFRDMIDAGPGNDDVFGSYEGDTILLGDGDDWVNAGWDDRGWGQVDDDFVRGGSGNDVAYGGIDNDDLGGGPGIDQMWGLADDDKLDGGTGRDYMYGDSGDDELRVNDLEFDDADCGADQDVAVSDEPDNVVNCEQEDFTPPQTPANPTPQIISPTAGSWRRTDSVSVYWLDASTAVSTTCSVDGAAFVACTSPLTVSGNGWHTVVVSALDANGNVGSDTRSFGIDNQPISVSLFAPQATARTRPILDLAVSTGSGVASMRCSVDAVFTDMIPCSDGMEWPTELAVGSHMIYLEVVNNAGDLYSMSSPFQIVPSPPSFQITTPQPGEVLEEAQVTWPTRPAVVSTECSVDGASFEPCASPLSVTSAGPHNVVVRQTDDIGGVGTASIAFAVDSAVVVNITEPDGFISDTTPVVRFTASAASGIANTTCHIPDSYPNPIPCYDGMEWPYPLSDGPHSLYVGAFSNTGLYGMSQQTFSVDAVVAVNITEPDGWGTDTTPVVRFSADAASGVSATTCHIAGSSTGFIPCTDGMEWPYALSDGTHTLQVNASANSGGVGSAAKSFVVETAGPQVTLNGPNPWGGRFTTIWFSASAPTGVAEVTCSVDGGTPVECWNGYQWPGEFVAGTSHSLQIVATSNGGHVSTYSYQFDIEAQATATLIAPPSPSNNPNPVFNFSSDAQSGTMQAQCQVDWGVFGWYYCADGFVWPEALSDGEHSLQVWIQSMAGQWANASVTITIDTTAPSAPSIGGPTGPSNSTQPTFWITAAEPDGTVECRVDNGNWTALATNQFDATLSGDGAKTIECRHTDEAGNVSESELHEYTLDGASPSVSIQLPLGGELVGPVVDVSFTATDAGSGIAETNCSVDGGSPAPCTSPFSTPALDPGAHYVAVQAIDGAGNSASTPVNFTVAAPPVVTITSPSPGELIANTTVPVAFNATNSPTAVTCQLDSGSAETCASPKSYAGLAQGEHTVLVTAANIGGSDTESISFNVDSIAPEAPSVGGPTGPSNSSQPTFWITAAESGGSVECRVGSGSWFTLVSNEFSPTLSGDGLKTIACRQTDAAGNMSASDLHEYTLDGTSPSVSIQSPSNGATLGATVSVSFTAIDPGSGITETNCAVDAGSPAPCTSPFTTPALAPGSHSVNVQALDGAGNSATTSVIFTVVAPPVVTITSPSQGARIANGTVSVAFSATNAPTSITCQLDAGSAQACSSPSTFSGLTQGNHAVLVTASNVAGSDAESIMFTVDTVAPDTVIDSGPAASSTTDDPTPTFSFHGNPAADTAGFDCRINSGSWSSCGSGQSGSMTLPALTPGSNTFDVRARDDVGNADGSHSTRTFTFTVPGLLSAGTKVSLPTGTPINLTTAGTAGWAHWGTTSSTTESVLLAPSRKNGTTAGDISNATRTGSVTTARVTSGIPQSTWSGAGDPTGSPTTTAISAGGSTSGGFSLTLAAPAGVARTANLYLGARSTTGKLVVSISDGSAPTYTDTAVVTAGTTAASVRVPITFRAVNPGATVSIQYTQNTTSTSGRVYLESVALSDSADTTPPETTITSGPVAGGVVTTATTSFGFSSSEGSSTFQCKIDNGSYSTCATPFTTPTLAVGPHTFRVRAIDPSGNVDPTPATVADFWVSLPVGLLSQGTKSALSVSTPINLTTVGTGGWAHWGTGTSTTESVLLAPTRKSGTTSSVISNATRSGTTTTSRVGVGIPQTQWNGAGDPSGSPTTTAIQAGGGTAVGGGFSFTVAVPNTNSRTINLYLGALNTTGRLVATLSDGSAPAITDTSVVTGTTAAANVLVPITVRAANAGATLSIQYTQNTVASTGRVYLESVALINGTDTTAPVTTITSGPANGSVITSSSATFTFSSSESATTQCRVDGATFTACTSPFVASGLAQGSHTVDVRSIDAQGNVEPKPPRRSFTVQ